MAGLASAVLAIAVGLGLLLSTGLVAMEPLQMVGAGLVVAVLLHLWSW
jgi:hypothetical protein